MAEANPTEPVADTAEPAVADEEEKKEQPTADEEEKKGDEEQKEGNEEESKEKAKKEVLGWDGKPLLTPEEVKRQVELFKPMIDDLW